MRHNSDASRLHGSPGVVLRDDILFECLIVFDVFQSDNDGFGSQSVPRSLVRCKNLTVRSARSSFG